MKNIKRTTLGLFIGGSFILGLALGYCIKKTVDISTTYSIRDKSDNYKFISPLLAIDSLSNAPSPEYQALYNKVQDYIKQESLVGDDTSVYFIDYAHGGRFVIKGNDLYSPASLMKVVVMIAYFKKAETDPNILDTKMLYQSDMQAALDSAQFDTPSTLEVGQSYAVSDLINDMIINSDNGAMNILVDNIGYPYLEEVYDAFGFKGPTATETDYKISPSDYSLFFRTLYNATYLGPDMSEKALSILSQATFDDGITAPLPKGTVVAHKFGEHVYADAPGTPQALELHDCGIIYAPQSPYFLCVMTHGVSLDVLEDRIQGISSLVYNAVIGKK